MLYFPCTGTLGWVACLAPQLFLPVYPDVNVDLLVCQPLPCPVSSPPWLPVSAPLISLDECFFNSLVVGLLYSSISQQFWLFFIFKLVIILLLVVQGSEVYLPSPPSWLEAKNHSECGLPNHVPRVLLGIGFFVRILFFRETNCLQRNDLQTHTHFLLCLDKKTDSHFITSGKPTSFQVILYKHGLSIQLFSHYY